MPGHEGDLRTTKLVLRCLCFIIPFLTTFSSIAQLSTYNPIWTTPSKNSSQSMPVGGGDIGLNVWVENGDILFYVARSGTFDENNSLLKQGRVRLRLSPNPFENGDSFKQELILNDGYVKINGSKGSLASEIKIWVDVFKPVVHIEINSNKPITTTENYESWRHQDRRLKGKENNQNSYKWAPQGEVKTFKDEIAFAGNMVQFYHQNKPYSVFDVTVKQQGMDEVKSQLFNPLKNLIFGGMLNGENMVPSGNSEGKYIDTEYRSWNLRSVKATRSQKLNLSLHTAYTPLVEEWKSGLLKSVPSAKSYKQAFNKTQNWWNNYWKRSFIFINPENTNAEDWQVGRNYQLFRYMLGCNAYGKYPTKFNGGLFTYDPSFTDSTLKFTPDFRNWGGGTHTAQNQRLVYWPMLKSGDFDKWDMFFYIFSCIAFSFEHH